MINNKLLRIALYPLFFLSCFNTLTGHIGISGDILKSKKRAVFVCEYTIPISPCIVNDSIKLHLLSAWLEKQWKYVSDVNETQVLNGYQLIAIFKSEDLNYYNKEWTIGNSFKDSFRFCGPGCMVAEFDSVPQSDSITWSVQLGNAITKISKYEIIGKYIMVRK
jgi:hypothetical protein